MKNKGYTLHAYPALIGILPLVPVRIATIRPAGTHAISNASIVYLGRSGNLNIAFAVNRVNTEIVVEKGTMTEEVMIVVEAVMMMMMVAEAVMVMMAVVMAVVMVVVVMSMLMMILASRQIAPRARVGMQMYVPVSAMTHQRQPHPHPLQLHHHQQQQKQQQQQQQQRHRLTAYSTVLPIHRTALLVTAEAEAEPEPANRGMHGTKQPVRVSRAVPRHAMLWVDGTRTSVRASLVYLDCSSLSRHHHLHHR